MNISESSYVLKTGVEDVKRLNAQAQLTTVPLQEALTKWTERFDKNAILRLIDYGCGVGSSMELLKKQFTMAKYIGIDQSQEQIDT
ncbi:MAG TPA: hypothetical protein VGP47_09255, partial [Parachlamydiaceae bacterium]|nr:hypothetical protein [Parachlamydiaceae bacterium]